MSNPTKGLKSTQINLRVSFIEKSNAEWLATKAYEAGDIESPKLSKLIVFLLKQYMSNKIKP